MAQIIFLAVSFPAKSEAKNSLQLQFGDSISIYSEKAYRRDNGKIFEAIGNVVIISGNDTLYGEKASLNSKSGEVLIEGSVRYIGKNITLYGSKIHMNMSNNSLEMTNTRMITPDFSIVASKVIKKSDSIYFAEDAEFTTCRDCKESWLISGKKIEVELDRYVQIHNALVKVKGIDVLYVPYIAIPIKSKRESGLLFPEIYTRSGEGAVYSQPVYWAIAKDKDMTITPTFMGGRGYGSDLEYRQAFGDGKWMEFSNKMIMDSLYDAKRLGDSNAGTHEFRHFYEFESHMQWSNDFTQHLYVTGVQDLDFYGDFSKYTDQKLRGTDAGLDLFLDKRFNRLSLGLETKYKRNILVDDPTLFDKSYVQVLPSVSLSLMPQILYHQDRSFLNKLSYGLDSRFTSFKQDRLVETTYLRNVNRTEVYPYLQVNWANYGAVNLSSNFSLDYQQYNFHDEEQVNFYKHTNTIKTELSFTMDRIFGLAYEEVYQKKEFKEKDLLKFKKEKNSEISEKKAETNLIGHLPNFEDSLAKETFKIKRNSYRHSQEFKFIHHQILDSDENGNGKFLDQIQTENGWFDDNDIVKRDIGVLESNESRQSLPINNTFELQWNNSLIKKAPKNYHYLKDEKYLKDTFAYSKIGHFNISQGYLLSSTDDEFYKKLTRLLLDTSYTASTWNINLKDYYFHGAGNHILSFSGQKRFDRLSALTVYNYNSLDNSNIKTIKGGLQFRPHDVLGFSYLEEFDLDAEEKIQSIYQVDFMPNNNCWIINFNLKETLFEETYAFNFVFNFGNDEFKSYRNNFFNFSRLR